MKDPYKRQNYDNMGTNAKLWKQDLLTSNSCLPGTGWETHFTAGGVVVTTDAAGILVTVVVTGFFKIGTVLTAGCCTGIVTDAVVGFDCVCTLACVSVWSCNCFGDTACILTAGGPLFVPFDGLFTCLVKAAKSCAVNTIVLESVENQSVNEWELTDEHVKFNMHKILAFCT